MRKLTRKTITLILIPLIVLMLFSGCNKEIEKESVALRIGTQFTIVGGSPWSPFVNIGQNGLHQLIYDSLFIIDKNGFPEPSIVTELSQYDLTYNLTIKDGIFFHDGRELTSVDVADTLLRLIKLHSKSNPEAVKNFVSLESIELLGKTQLKLQLSEPDMFFLNALTFGITPAYNPDSLEITEWPVLFSTSGRELACSQLSEDPEENKVIEETYTRNSLIGSGPWKIDEKSLQAYNTTDSPMTLDLVANSDYWKGAPKIENISFKSIDTSQDSMNSYLLGKSIDIADPRAVQFNDLDSMQYYEKFKNAEHLTLVPHLYDYPNQMILFYYPDSSITSLNVRKAIAYAIDKEALLEVQKEVDDSGGQITSQYILPENEWYYEFDNAYEYNPELAKELLIEAGYEEGITVRSNGFYIDDPDWIEGEVAKEIQRQLNEVGIQIDWGPFSLEEKQEGIIDLSFNTGVQTSPQFFYNLMLNPEKVYYPLYPLMHESDTEFSKAIKAMMASQDTEVQKENYHKALQELNDQAHIIPLIAKFNYFTYNSGLTGVDHSNPNQIFVKLWQSSFE